jgi:glycosyltransferase involved in cell wall biosynthesis
VAVDISTLWHHDAGTGIQRVVRKLATELASSARSGKSIALVDYSTGIPLNVTHAFLEPQIASKPLERITGMEMLIMLDSSYNLAPSFSRRLREAKSDGVFVVSVCHDLLPVTNPEWFLAVNHIPFRRWLKLAADYSSAFLCVSETTAARLRKHLATKQRASCVDVSSWPLGRDLDSWVAPTGSDFSHGKLFALMVGTVEPRKNHSFVVKALGDMQAAGKNPPHLVVVGRYGWKNKSAARLLRKAQKEGWVTWHDHGVSDEHLAELYARSTCVIQASLDEGFGLPVAEAAAFGKPVVLSDIPVFREIARENGYFFQLADTESFAKALHAACSPGAKPTRTKAVTWQESGDLFWKQCLELQAIDRGQRPAKHAPIA